jgi:hypothetical protein
MCPAEFPPWWGCQFVLNAYNSKSSKNSKNKSPPMRTLSTSQCLENIGIPLWQPRRVLPGAKQILDFAGYTLHNAANKKIGTLCLEVSPTYPDAFTTENLRLLDTMLSAIQLTRAPMLEKQVTHADHLVLIMGELLAHAALASEVPLDSLRAGNPHAHTTGAQWIVTYPPAHLRQNPSDKAKAWEDLKKLQGLLSRNAQ